MLHLPSPRLTVMYWPVRHFGSRPSPGLTLQRTPDPACPDCDGSGYVAYDIDCIDERPCHCTPEDPLAFLPLPRIVNRHYRQTRRRVAAQRKARGWTCWFCGAGNDGGRKTCGFCNYGPL